MNEIGIKSQSEDDNYKEEEDPQNDPKYGSFPYENHDVTHKSGLKDQDIDTNISLKE